MDSLTNYISLVGIDYTISSICLSEPSTKSLRSSIFWSTLSDKIYNSG